jgi:hypothetical protein
MTAIALGRAAPARSLPVPLVLGLQEGRRIVVHPIAVLGAAMTMLLVAIVGDDGPRNAFDVISTGPTFYYGVFVYFAANLVASRDRRAHSRELLAPASSPASSRVAGLCVAALVPALACAAFVLAVHTLNHARELYVVAPDVWHLAQAPLTVLGGALLGIMVARLSSIPGTALLVMVAMFAWNVWVSNHDEPIQPLGTFVSWAAWGPDYSQAGWFGVAPGSPAWHVAYLAALCAMAATGAFLREAPRRGPVLAVGAVFTLVAVVTGLLQLP